MVAHFLLSALSAILPTGLCLRYRAGHELALRDVSFAVPAGAKVAVVGRSGAGKSSLLLGLLRLLEPETGAVTVDGRDLVADVGLYDLRRGFSIVPQRPHMLAGTLRVNLDPFGEHPDARIWEALAACGCARAVEHLPLLLDAPVHDGGCNFSHGERQLMCLARAVLARRRVVLIDEGLERSVDLSAGASF